MLEGSVRKAGVRVRVTAQLVEAASGAHIWADRYDGALDDIFDLQDEIGRRIAGIVVPELERTEFQRAPGEQPTDPEAWDYCLRGRSLLAAFDTSDNERAREMFERAIELEPGSSQAHAGLARSHYRDILLGNSRDHEGSAANCLAAARRGVELDRMDSYAHMVLAIAHTYDGAFEPSVSEAETAVKLNPSNAQAYFTLGLCLSVAGRAEEGQEHIDNGFRLNPYEPGNHVYFCMKAHAHFTGRQYDDAVEWARKSERLRPEARDPHILLTSALGWLGRQDEARSELTAAGLLDAALDVKGGWFQWQRDADQEHFLEGLRKAGWKA